MNQLLADMFEEVAVLLEQHDASPHRVRAWRDGARSIREYDRDVVDVFRDYGRAGLEAIPHIGAKLSASIIEVIRTGRCGALDRLRGEAQSALEQLPGIGHELADRIHERLGIETLEELEAAVHDGRLAAVDGFGPRRIAMLRDLLATRLSRARRRRTTGPPVSLLLAIDREYRDAAAAGRLRKIAPRRFNPKHEAWLPIMHTERDGWSFTAMFSNTALAHRLGRTDDWVVVYFHLPDQPAGQATVVTERTGRQRGQRVVRGREHESVAHWTDLERRAS